MERRPIEGPAELDLSVVVPVYGCREALPELHRRLCAVLEQLVESFEIILVDDACPQGSWDDIARLAALDARVVGVKLARNFGQICAITAGLDRARGAWCVVMDCDLQDRPEHIPALWQAAHEAPGYDAVFARRVARKDAGGVKLLSRAFYKVYDYFTDGAYDPDVSNFSLLSRPVAQAYCRLREHARAYTMYVKWLGFAQRDVPLEGDERFAGTSSYTFRKKMALAGQIITAQSNKPLRFAVNLGFAFAALAFVFLVVLLVHKLVDPAVAVGWTSAIGAVVFMGGLILAAVGVAGIYIGNIFTEAKGRPLYVVARQVNGKDVEW